jgi:adenylyl-sulfate kinase
MPGCADRLPGAGKPARTGAGAGTVGTATACPTPEPGDPLRRTADVAVVGPGVRSTQESVITSPTLSPLDEHRLDLPDARIDGRVARDVDLALLGLLPRGQRLGGPVAFGTTRPPTPASRVSAPLVSLELDAAVAAAARRGGGVVLRDEELTPLARLELDGADAHLDGAGTSSRPPAASGAARSGADAPTAPTGGADRAGATQEVVVGRLRRVREREAGQGRRLVVDTGSLWPETGRAVVVFGRPPVAGDREALDHALAGTDEAPDHHADHAVTAAAPTTPSMPSTPSTPTTDATRQPVLALVSDDPTAAVPTQVMLDVVRLWFDDLGLTDAQVRTAPLAWRDPASNAALAARLGSALGGSPTVFVDPDDGSRPARAWDRSWRALEAGDPAGDLGELSPRIAHRLQRWRPPRDRRGLVLMFSGLSGSGKSTLARDVGDWVATHSERTVTLLDGDVVRTMLSSGLGFSKADRELNIRRIGYVGSEIARHGGIAICAPIAPYAATREAVRGMVRAVGDFVLVHVSTPLEACEARDLKGLYAKARAGLIAEFTGISDPYEVPTDAALAVDTSVLSRDEALAAVVDLLRTAGYVPPRDATLPPAAPPFAGRGDRRAPATPATPTTPTTPATPTTPTTPTSTTTPED